MKDFQLTSKSVEQTLTLGHQLARHLLAGDIVCLFGDLGSGKTTLTKGIARGLKVDPRKVNSPTFVLMNEYRGKTPLFHFDFYRLEKQAEISLLGYEEFFYGQGISVIEWPQRLGDLLPKEYLRVELSVRGEHERQMKISAVGVRPRTVLRKLTS